MGTVTLRPPQREALARVGRLLDQTGGCLLADDVGRGKTFVALAAARRWTRPLLAIPASLADGWRLAMRQCGVEHPLVTHEALSRGGRPSFRPDGIIVDESHHFRNPATRRYAGMAELAAQAESLLLSATPVQNAASDLAAQLALFIGSVAWQLDDPARARFVVRVDADDCAAGLPRVDPPRWVPLACDDGAVLDALVTLPAPPRALDAGDAGALRTMALVRAWASSRAALMAAIARRHRTAAAIAQSLGDSRLPTRAELRSWRAGGDDVIQLGFASLLAAREVSPAELELARGLEREIEAEQAALGRLRVLLAGAPHVDHTRVRALASLADMHPGARTLAFTQLAVTARAYYEGLRHRPGVGLLTAAGGIIASGRISRRELLARFAPGAQGRRAPAPSERVSLLVSTDLLSEGVNLQDASVVVHLDMPWNPARLAQRVGRVRRPGAGGVVRSFLLAPPATAEQLLSVETRLRRKLDAATRTIGGTLTVLPVLTLSGDTTAPRIQVGHAEHRSRAEARLSRWRDADLLSPSDPITAAAVSPELGWLVVLRGGRLLAKVGSRAGDDAALLDRATECAGGTATCVAPARVDEARRELEQFLRHERLLLVCGRTVMSPDALRAQRRVAQVAAAAPRHQRPACTELAARVHAALGRPMPLGAERSALRAVERPPANDGAQAWLSDLLACLPRRDTFPAHVPADDRVVALIVFGPVHFAAMPAADA